MVTYKKQFLTLLVSITFIINTGCSHKLIFEDIPVLDDLESFLAETISAISTGKDNNENDVVGTSHENDVESATVGKGSLATVFKHDTHEIYEVEIQKIFHAASGRRCIQYYEPNIKQGKYPNGLACLNDENTWIQIPKKVIVNDS